MFDSVVTRPAKTAFGGSAVANIYSIPVAKKVTFSSSDIQTPIKTRIRAAASVTGIALG